MSTLTRCQASDLIRKSIRKRATCALFQPQIKILTSHQLEQLLDQVVEDYRLDPDQPDSFDQSTADFFFSLFFDPDCADLLEAILLGKFFPEL